MVGQRGEHCHGHGAAGFLFVGGESRVLGEDLVERLVAFGAVEHPDGDVAASVSQFDDGMVGGAEVLEPLRLVGAAAGGAQRRPASVPFDVGNGCAGRLAGLAAVDGEDEYR